MILFNCICKNTKIKKKGGVIMFNYINYLMTFLPILIMGIAVIFANYKAGLAILIALIGSILIIIGLSILNSLNHLVIISQNMEKHEKKSEN